MKKLRKGFTLIELLVVIAIIGILATTVAPKLREQLAKAKDSKAIALLGAARTSASVALVDAMVSSQSGVITLTYEDIKNKLDGPSQGLLSEEGLIAIGGSRKEAEDSDSEPGSVVYGGNVALNNSTGTPIIKGVESTGDSIDLVLKAGDKDTGELSTEGKAWDAY